MSTNDQMPFERSHAPKIEELNQLFQGYTFRSLIAVGGMGAVYLAQQDSLERNVAIKILPRRYSRDPEFVEAFTQEAKTIAKLNHHNLVAIFDFGVKAEMPFLVMEFVEGEALDRIIQRSLFGYEQAAQMMVDLCQGLKHAHKRGVVHRDVKPANLILDRDNDIKIVDFGIAKQCGYIPLKPGELVYGTAGFIAPEITKSPEMIDPRSDVYSIGATLCQIVTGYTPEQLSENGIDQRHTLGPIYPVVFKAIRSDASMRYQTVKELSDALSVALQPQPAAIEAPDRVSMELHGDGVNTPLFGAEALQMSSKDRLEMLRSGTNPGTDQAVVLAGRYQLGQCLRQGSRTMIYLAEDILMHRTVKLRLFFKSDSDQWSTKYLEILANLSKVEHPNIPKVLDAGFYDAGAFIVYGWNEGQNISQLLERNHGYENYYALAVHILDALEVASHYGFHHHAFNTLSVVREERSLGGSRFMLMDVGVSEVLELIHVDNNHLPGVLNEWAAPELFEHQPAGEMTTLYSFAQLLITVIIKGHPLATMAQEQVAKVLNDGFKVNVRDYRADLPEEFCSWLDRLLEPNISKRFGSLREARKSMPKRPKSVRL